MLLNMLRKGAGVDLECEYKEEGAMSREIKLRFERERALKQQESPGEKRAL